MRFYAMEIVLLKFVQLRIKLRRTASVILSGQRPAGALAKAGRAKHLALTRLSTPYWLISKWVALGPAWV